MADKKISDLTAGTTPDGTEVLPAVQSGATVKLTVADLRAVTPLSVTDIDDPSAELNAIAGGTKGDMVLCYQTVAGADEWTLYAWDNADSDGESVPFTVDGSSGMWSAVAGKYNRGDSKYTGSQRTKVVTLSDAASIAIDARASNVFEVTLGGNRTLANPTNVEQGMAWVVEVTQDATAGRTLGFGGNYVGPGTSTDLSADTSGQQRAFSFYAFSATKILVVDSAGVAV